MTIERIISSFLKTGAACTSDERGYYICDDGINPGLYLYADGIIREGVVSDDSSAFWENEKDAKEFLASWQIKRIQKDIKNGN